MKQQSNSRLIDSSSVLYRIYLDSLDIPIALDAATNTGLMSTDDSIVKYNYNNDCNFENSKQKGGMLSNKREKHTNHDEREIADYINVDDDDNHEIEFHHRRDINSNDKYFMTSEYKSTDFRSSATTSRIDDFDQNQDINLQTTSKIFQTKGNKLNSIVTANLYSSNLITNSLLHLQSKKELMDLENQVQQVKGSVQRYSSGVSDNEMQEKGIIYNNFIEHQQKPNESRNQLAYENHNCTCFKQINPKFYKNSQARPSSSFVGYVINSNRPATFSNLQNHDNQRASLNLARYDKKQKLKKTVDCQTSRQLAPQSLELIEWPSCNTISNDLDSNKLTNRKKLLKRQLKRYAYSNHQLRELAIVHPPCIPSLESQNVSSSQPRQVHPNSPQMHEIDIVSKHNQYRLNRQTFDCNKLELHHQSDTDDTLNNLNTESNIQNSSFIQMQERTHMIDKYESKQDKNENKLQTEQRYSSDKSESKLSEVGKDFDDANQYRANESICDQYQGNSEAWDNNNNTSNNNNENTHSAEHTDNMNEDINRYHQRYNQNEALIHENSFNNKRSIGSQDYNQKSTDLKLIYGANDNSK